jgi:hypothetical protein
VRNISALIEVPVFVITLMLSNATASAHPGTSSARCRVLPPNLNERNAKERMALAEKLIGIEFR